MGSRSSKRSLQTPGSRWSPLSQLAVQRVPIDHQHWICDRDSLTRQVKRVCNGQFRVRVLRQRWTYVDKDDVQVLGVVSSQAVIVREVQLMCDEKPLVYARSLIPRAVLRGHYAVLGQMGNRPLGEKLFADPVMQRGEVAFSCLTRGSRGYRVAVKGVRESPQRIWGRRSLFAGASAPVMVTEFFLPGLGKWPDPGNT